MNLWRNIWRNPKEILEAIWRNSCGNALRNTLLKFCEGPQKKLLRYFLWNSCRNSLEMFLRNSKNYPQRVRVFLKKKNSYRKSCLNNISNNLRISGETYAVIAGYSTGRIRKIFWRNPLGEISEKFWDVFHKKKIQGNFLAEFQKERM